MASFDIEKLFDKLFNLLQINNKTTADLVNETGKHRGSVDTVIQIFREKPCVEDTIHEDLGKIKDLAIKQITEAKDTAITKIKSEKDTVSGKLVTVIVIISILNTSALGLIAYFLYKTPQFWEVLKIYLQR